MTVESSLKLFLTRILRRFLYPFAAFVVIWAILPAIQTVPADGLRWWAFAIIPMAFVLGTLPLIYFLMVPLSIDVSHDAVVLRYKGKKYRIEKNTIKESTLIQFGKHPGQIKIAIKDRNSHTINLTAFTDSDRDILCKAILGAHSPLLNKPSLDEWLDYSDWLPERLLGSKIFGSFWNWGTKYSILIPLQMRPPARRKGFIQWKRINEIFSFTLVLFFTGLFCLGGLIVLLQLLTSEEFATRDRIVRFMIYSPLAAYLLIFLIVGGYRRVKLLKRIKEDLDRHPPPEARESARGKQVRNLFNVR